jgi:ADP-ribose pyrophosphatase YjhB (NUDIX family)
VLLVRYGDPAKYDDEAGWFLPDDTLEHLEHPTRAAQRIAREQLGLTLDDVSLGLIESFPGTTAAGTCPSITSPTFRPCPTSGLLPTSRPPIGFPWTGCHPARRWPITGGR